MRYTPTRTKKVSFRDIVFDGDNWIQYQSNNHPSVEVIEAVEKIGMCRTGKLGCHYWFCEKCGYGGKTPHSCKSKLCSSCATIAMQNWLAKVLPTLLDVKHFQIVFTLPPKLYPIFIANKKILFNLFFKVASDAIITVAKTMDFTPGVIGVFHSFGSGYRTHPHIHFMVTAGGISPDKKEWLEKKFWPLEITRDYFKALICKHLRKLVQENKIFNPYGDYYDFNEVIKDLYLKNWNMFIEFKGGEGKARFGLSYITRYAKRAIISDRSILDYNGEYVTFKQKKKTYTYKKMEFIEKVLKHVAPKYFKITRFYGIYSNQKKKKLIPLAMELSQAKKIEGNEKKTWRERRTTYSGVDPILCPVCGTELTLIEVTYSSRIPDRWQGILTLLIFDKFL